MFYISSVIVYVKIIICLGVLLYIFIVSRYRNIKYVVKMVKFRNIIIVYVYDVFRIMGGIKKLKLMKEIVMVVGRKLKILLVKVDVVEKVCVICMEFIYIKKILVECDIEGGVLRVMIMFCLIYYICDNCIR